MAASTCTLPGEVANAITQFLPDLVGDAAMAQRRTRFGFLESLRSPINRNGRADIRYDQGNSKTREVDIFYTPRAPDSFVATSRSSTCETTNERGQIKDSVSVSLTAQYSEVIQDCYVRQIEQGKTEWLKELLSGAWNTIGRQIETTLITSAATQFGINASTGNANVITKTILDAAADEQPQISVWNGFMDTEMEDANEFQGMPIIVGQGAISRFMKTQQWACCSDLGFDFAAAMRSPDMGAWYFKSQLTNSAIATDRCLVYEPGALQLLTYHRNRGQGTDIVFDNNGAYGAYNDNAGDSAGLIVDPINGIVYDMDVVYDKCSRETSIFLTLCYDLWVMPSDQLDATDPLYGVNGLYNYKFQSA